ncbi:hypothetical protein C2G38_2026587 [Gigaspora rosea]|uniref:Histidine kinase-like ATPase n=1 Tax=Gigaspora rosea TaxID=44941 RepID=A0A397WDX5_9GLOM|nr:hypothetical protein C2G38_2026587 [Gigaspora rosea]
MSTNNGINKQEEIKVVDLLNSHDWSSTCLGSLDSWEPSFRNIVNLFFHSKFPTTIFCGPDLIYIYNQANVPYLKADHPSEEFYISTAKSPIFKEDGTLLAVLCVTDYTTHKVLAERRIKTLSDLANHINDADSLESACHIIMKSFRENDKDIPFALIYLIDNYNLKSGIQPCTARLISTTFNYKDLYNKNWDIPDNLLDTLKTINLIENPDENYDLFIESSNGSEPILSSILICGINPNRELDDDYTNFLQSVVTYASTAITNGKLREEKRNQVEMLTNLNHQKLKFFENISRELLTPLTLILSPLNEVINSCLQETIMHSRLQIIQRNTHRLLKLVDNLLQFSNIESDQLEAHYSETDIAQLTQELASNFNSIAEKLGSNAFKNTWIGQIKVRLYIENENERNTIIFELSDTGVGISEVDLLNIFHRIKSQQSRSYEGTGIGLALVKELITYHGGKISVTSKVGQGTTFKCRFLTGFKHLPKNRVYLNKNELNQERHLYTKKQLYLEEGMQWVQSNELTNKKFILNPESIDDNDNADFGNISLNKTEKQRHKILLVEDNVDMRNHLVELLRNEFEVYCVYNGYDAIMFLKKSIELPDLILSDVMMPIINGYELLNMLRSNIATRLIPFILLTARADENSELRTPLGAIIGICSSVENESLNVQQKDMIKILLHSSNIALSLIKNIPNIMNIEEYKSASVNRVFDLLDLFENAIEVFGERAGSKRIELALNYNSDTLPKYVKSNPERIKFTEEGEIIMKVLLKSSSNKSIKDENFIKLLIILSDTGIGLNSEFINNWESNLKVDELKIMQQDGTGFGLLAYSFDTYNEGIKTAKYYKELYNQSPYCMAFINIDENNIDEGLLKKLIKKIGGKITGIFKPITPKKLLSHYFQNYIEENIINEVTLNIFKE